MLLFARCALAYRVNEDIDRLPDFRSGLPEAALTEAKVHIRVDQNGVYRVGRSRVMLDSNVAGFHQGRSAETTKQQYPALTAAEVYGSIANYLGHIAEVDSYLGRQNSIWAQRQTRGAAQHSPVVERLRSLIKAGASEAK